MKKLLLLALLAPLLFLSGCASINKVESGTRAVGERLTLSIDRPWNHVAFPGIEPGEMWTLEGTSVDELRIFSGIKNGEVMHPAGFDKTRKSFAFRSTMPTEEIVAMFEGIVTRDQSSFTLTRVEPYPFAGRKGFRFEFARERKGDGVQQRGVGYGAVDRNELFAIVYIAPRLTYFDKYLPRVEALAKSAQIK